jgi:hypothetical protein
MQSIDDTIEGLTKAVIQKMFDDFIQNTLDDSEYIRNIKSVIQATDSFLKSHKGLVNVPESFGLELYRFAQSLWLQHHSHTCPPPKDEVQNEMEEDSYYEYYFDYLYQYGKYPM